MALTTKNILLVVEGGKDEPRLVEALLQSLVPDVDRVIFPYEANIHALIEKIVNDYDGDYENLEICGVLVDMLLDGEDEKRDLLTRTKFTDVILMFDFDPQDNRLNLPELRRMVEAFSESTDTDRGLLLLNYPAVEAVKVAAALPYEQFIDCSFSCGQSSTFKAWANEIVGESGDGRLFSFERYDITSFLKAIARTVGKIQCLVQGVSFDETFPMIRSGLISLSGDCLDTSRIDVLDYESELLADSGEVTVLATGLLFVAMWGKELDGAWKSCFGE